MTDEASLCKNQVVQSVLRKAENPTSVNECISAYFSAIRELIRNPNDGASLPQTYGSETWVGHGQPQGDPDASVSFLLAPFSEVTGYWLSHPATHGQQSTWR